MKTKIEDSHSSNTRTIESLAEEKKQVVLEKSSLIIMTNDDKMLFLDVLTQQISIANNQT